MRYANVVLDIPTRSLDGAFCYAVPMGLGSVVVVGTTVLVPFSHRDVVGYVVGITDRPADGVDPDRVLPVRQVLADAAFDEVAAGVAAWIAHEYACPLCDAVRPFLAPGQKVRVVRASADSPWELVSEKAGPVDVRWASLTEAGASFEPARNASRQREVVEALRRGPQRVAELAAMIPGASTAVTALARRGVVIVEERRQVRGREGTSLSSAAAPRPEHLTDGQLDALAAIEIGRAHV